MRVSYPLVLVLAAASAASAATLEFDRGLPSLPLLRSIKEAPVPPAAQDDAGYFEYELKAYPAEGETCPAAAARLGKEMARITGLKSVDGRCADVSDKGYAITLRYQAPERLNLVSTTRAGSGAYGFPDYASKAECSAAVAGEKERFARNTGLTPLVAYCLAEEYSSGWTLRVDGFGTADRAPHLDGTLIFGRILDLSEAQFLSAVRGGLARLGADVSVAKVRPSMGYAEVTVLYYAKERNRLETVEAAKVLTRAQCDEQLALAKRAVGSGSNTLLSYCGSTIAMAPFEVDVLTAGGGAAASNAYEHYATYEACMAGRSKMEEYYRGQLGAAVVGSLCGVEEGVWHAVILKTR